MEGSGAMMTENSTNSTVPCSPFAGRDYAIVAAISSASALVSVILCTGVIVLMVLFKKYNFFIQRLILYLTIVALAEAVAVTLHRVDYNGANSATEGFCVFIGFVDQTTSWAILIAISCITVNLMLNAVFHKRTEKFEKLYFVLIFVFPITFNWIPFIELAYGSAGAWCWIRSENKDCSSFTFGVVLRFCSVVCPPLRDPDHTDCDLHHHTVQDNQGSPQVGGKVDPESQQLKEQMQKEVKPLIVYPLIYLLINVVPLINRIHNTVSPSNPELALWILHALLFPLQGGDHSNSVYT